MQSVRSHAPVGLVPCGVLGDHRLAAARVSGDRVEPKREFPRDDTGIDERPHQQDEARRIAAGIADPPRGSDRIPRRLPLQFRQSVHPAVGCPVRRARIEDARGRRQRHGVSRRIVRQAQNGQVRRLEIGAAACRFLAFGFGDFEQFHIAARPDPVRDLKPGRPRLAVYEYLVHTRDDVSAKVASPQREAR